MHLHILSVTMPDEREHALPVLPCTCANLRRAARAATQLYDRHLRESGINAAQFTLLQSLSRVGPITQGGLGKLLALDSTTLSRTLRPLEAKKWIRSEPGKDRRERRFVLTASGHAQFQRSMPFWQRAQQALRAGTRGDRWEAVLADLAVLAAVAGRV
jgi:DNA-binding MarR family transcriptional regulator